MSDIKVKKKCEHPVLAVDGRGRVGKMPGGAKSYVLLIDKVVCKGCGTTFAFKGITQGATNSHPFAIDPFATSIIMPLDPMEPN